jgi:hypothetical protein
MVDLTPNDLVKDLGEGLKDWGPEAFGKAVAAATTAEGVASAVARSSDVSRMVTFEGYLGATVTRAGKFWCVLYLDLELQTWLLVEKDCILDRRTTDHSTWPRKRDTIWVTADAGVGLGSGSQSVDAQFLTGEFTRAGDFEAPPTGGTLAAATGVFCQARTPSCCRRRSQT